ncbi:hypothetical protein LJC04_00220 [Ruminococcaceae bacterium OttesenSCG-928-O06]|nr:hypothetical protein [Ruminococcaceae bacterium OttesenSCG-928-O06]
MAKRLMRWAVVACVLLLLAGCSPITFQGVNDLLRAPALDQAQDEIRKALVAYLGGVEPKYKFPKEGDWRSFLLLADLDGNGLEEAVLLYSMADVPGAPAEKGTSVYVAVLEQQNGAWQVTQDVQGLSTDVASLEVADLLGGEGMQLIIGYATANFNAKTLGLYTYQNATLAEQHRLEYSRYEIGDFTGSGKQELAVVSREDQNLQLLYIPVVDGAFAGELAPVALDSNFTQCTGLVAGQTHAGERLLVVDGTSSDTSALFTQFVYYSGARFYTIDDLGTMRASTARQNPLLLSRDIDGDGVVEIPLRMGENAIETIRGDKRLEYVEWMDFTDPEEGAVYRQYGLLDSDRAVYIRLPDEWRNAVRILDGENAGEWVLQNRLSGATLLSLHVLEQSDPEPFGYRLVPGTISTYLRTHTMVSAEARETIDMLLLQ